LPGNEKVTKFLGYAGLIPFLVFSLGHWMTLPWVNDPSQILIAYAAVILSFMGAIHWGAAITNSDGQHSTHLIVSVLPALTAWSALLLPVSIAIVILLCGFILLLVYELVFARPQGLPCWYISMRIILTTVVSFCLMISLTAVIIK
jgi:hypothetical protein